MNVSSDLPVSIFKREKDGKVYYSLGLFKKDLEGNYINGYINCQFKKDVKIDINKKIYLKSAWLTFYLENTEKYKITKPYIFINEFDYVEDIIKQDVKEDESKNVGKEVDPFEDFANEVELKDEDLPF